MRLFIKAAQAALFGGDTHHVKAHVRRTKSGVAMVQSFDRHGKPGHDDAHLSPRHRATQGRLLEGHGHGEHKVPAHLAHAPTLVKQLAQRHGWSFKSPAKGVWIATVHDDRGTQWRVYTDHGGFQVTRESEEKAAEIGRKLEHVRETDQRLRRIPERKRRPQGPDDTHRQAALVKGEPVLGPPPHPNRHDHPYEGTIDFQGIPVLVENRVGSKRSGHGWEVTMSAHYGEVGGTLGMDGDPVDVFVGPDAEAPFAYVIHQKFPGTQVPDEDKVVLGVGSRSEAVALYREHYTSGGFFDGVTRWPVSELREHLKHRGLAGERLDQPRAVRVKLGKAVLLFKSQMGLFGGAKAEHQVKTHVRRTKSGVTTVQQHASHHRKAAPKRKRTRQPALLQAAARLFPDWKERALGSKSGVRVTSALSAEEAISLAVRSKREHGAKGWAFDTEEQSDGWVVKARPQRGTVVAPPNYPEVADGHDPEYGDFEVEPGPGLDPVGSKYLVGHEMHEWNLTEHGMETEDGRTLGMREAIREMQRRGGRLMYQPNAFGPDMFRDHVGAPLREVNERATPEQLQRALHAMAGKPADVARAHREATDVVRRLDEVLREWDNTAGAVVGHARHDNGPNNVADPRLPSPRENCLPLIISLDGTWHRPFTTLECAALQSYDWRVLLDGGLAGTSVACWRGHIGNSVPPDAARAIFEVMAETLLLAQAGETFRLDARPIWVQPLATALSVDGVAHA